VCSPATTAARWVCCTLWAEWESTCQAIERLDDNTIPPKEIVLDSKLVVRGTTARPPA
jgi:hypothetical protein